mmetsp:Transcript_41618/g.86962  ORF Transcript_41618/g.86962 Transcript_41618/m.86962 type:complete len:109 (-) Transcript_41618:5812-6138(-)
MFEKTTVMANPPELRPLDGVTLRTVALVLGTETISNFTGEVAVPNDAIKILKIAPPAVLELGVKNVTADLSSANLNKTAGVSGNIVLATCILTMIEDSATSGKFVSST